MEWKKNNLFGMIAFLSYGLFWNSLIFLIILPGTGLAVAPTHNAMAVYMLIWGVFSLGMFVATLAKSPRMLSFLFFTVVILFLLLAIFYFTQVAVVA
jgi:succinate-acetate transporter protein